MNFEQLAKTRQSCRKYSNRAVEKVKLEKIAEIARLAPSACNTQPWKMHFITDPEKVVEFSSCLRDFGMNGFTKNVPAFIAVSDLKTKLMLGAKLKYDNDHFVKYDVGQLVAYITLAAEELGLSTCVLGWLNNNKIAQILNFDEDERCNIVIAIGYSDCERREKSRKKIEDITKWH